MLATRKPNVAYIDWHPGEASVQATMNLGARVPIEAIVDKLPEQHRIFHSSALRFLPVTTLDEQGRPWASVLCSKDGTPSFISSPSSTSLEIKAHVWDGDPVVQNVPAFKASLGEGKPPLISAIGLETSTRRRNKFGGSIVTASLRDCTLSLGISVSSALGLCPKYINVRDLESVEARPRVSSQKWTLEENDRLPVEVIDYIHNADTAYLATSYVVSPKDEDIHPSRLGTNHRGGRPGFVRVRRDERTLVLPNYAGNRVMNSLGNIHITPVASLVFPSFTSGSILYVTGTAQTLFGDSAQSLMPGIKVVTTIRTTGFSFVHNALPLHERPGTAESSPYCPPIRYLAEETPPTVRWGDVEARLVKAQIHNDLLVTYTLKADKPVEIRPSQNVVLDLSRFMRGKSHEVMDWEEPDTAVNDDCVRTWTVSVPPTDAEPSTFGITVRSVKGGFLTPILYRLIDSYATQSPQFVTNTALGKTVDLSQLDISIDLRGVGGNLPVPQPLARCDAPEGRKLLWIAGGIGLTPFLGLSRYVAELVGHPKGPFGVWDVALVVSTRETEVMLRLVNDALGQARSRSPDGEEVRESLRYVIHIFDSSLEGDEDKKAMMESWREIVPDFVELRLCDGRMKRTGEFWESKEIKAIERESHICGPLPFVRAAMEGLAAAGVDEEAVMRERFTY